MAKAPENMVLRTVYFPKALDNRLRDVAFRLDVSKGEYIRRVVEEALDNIGGKPARAVAAPKAAKPAKVAAAKPAGVVARKPKAVEPVVEAASPRVASGG